MIKGNNGEYLRIYKKISFLEVEYPNFKHWFFSKVIAELSAGKRSIYTEFNSRNDLMSLLILKHDGIQNKICTLWVNDNHQKEGLGSKLIETSIQKLETEHPLITVSDVRLSQFEPLLNKYNFNLHSAYESYYRQHITEFSFNEEIEKVDSVWTKDILEFNGDVNFPKFESYRNDLKETR